MSVGTKTIGTASTTVLARNTARSLLVLCNASDETIFLGFDEAAVQNSGVALKPLGPPLEIRPDGPLSSLLSGAVYGICASGQKALSYTVR